MLAGTQPGFIPLGAPFALSYGREHQDRLRRGDMAPEYAVAIRAAVGIHSMKEAV